MDDNVMRKYTTRSDEARHYVQYDQGEHLIFQWKIAKDFMFNFLSGQARTDGFAHFFFREDIVSNIQLLLMPVSFIE